MRFVSVRDLRGKSAEIWRRLPAEKDLVVTANGRPVAILSTVSEASVEDSLRAIRRARAVLSVAELQRSSVKRGTHRLSPREIDAEVRAARRSRR